MLYDVMRSDPSIQHKSSDNHARPCYCAAIGYGRVGKMVCDMLDRMPVRYIALDSSPIKAIEARGKGLPVFYGEFQQRSLRTA